MDRMIERAMSPAKLRGGLDGAAYIVQGIAHGALEIAPQGQSGGDRRREGAAGTMG